MPFRFITIALLLAAIATTVVAPHALGKDKGCGRNQDCALNAFKSGDIRPLSEVLSVALEKVPGEVVKVELDKEDDIWVYEVKILTSSGRRKEVEINAKTLDIIKID